MTAPNYEDKDVVMGITKETLGKIIWRNESGKAEDAAADAVRVSYMAFDLWDARDKARETAALQDKAIHESTAWVWVLEKLWMAVRQAKNTGYMPKFTVVDKALVDIGIEKAKRDGSNKQGEEK